MKLALRFTVAVVLAIALVLGLHAYFQARAQARMLDEDMRRDARVMGRLLAPLVADAWLEDGPEVARRMVSRTNEREASVQLRLVVLGDTDEASDGLNAEERAAIARQSPFADKKTLPDGDYLVNYVPVRLPQGKAAALEFAESLAGEHDAVASLLRSVGATTLALAGLCGAATMLLGVLFVGRPIRDLVSHARLVGRGHFEARTHVAQSDELGELARELDAMTEQIDAAQKREVEASNAKVAALEQLRHAERLATVGTLASGIAHELGTPIHVIIGHADLVRESASVDAENRESAEVIREQAKRMADIIRQLLDFARKRDISAREPTDLAPLVERVARLTAPIAERANVTVSIEAPDEGIVAPVDAPALAQVITNLLVNGIQAMPKGGPLTLRLDRVRQRRDDEDVELARIEVEDHGPGIAREALEHVFEPFFTTKPVGSGTGLGLSVAHGIVEEHGGRIEVSSEVGRGSRFSVWLPLEVPDDEEKPT